MINVSFSSHISLLCFSFLFHFVLPVPFFLKPSLITDSSSNLLHNVSSVLDPLTHAAPGLLYAQLILARIKYLSGTVQCYSHIHPFINSSLQLSIDLSIYPLIYPYTNSYIYLSSHHPSIYPSIYPSIHIPIHISIHLITIHPFIHLSTHLSVHPSNQPSIYQSNHFGNIIRTSLSNSRHSFGSI